MDLTTYGLFLLTSAAVGAAPGPSTLLVLSHALGQDPRRPASLIAGAFCGNVVLVLATVLGLSAVILASQTAFEIVRWIGAGYLIYLGVLYWRAPSDPVRARAAAGNAAYRALFLQAFVTSTTNPKGIVFYFAFLPLFVSPGLPPQVQLLILGSSYVVIFISALTIYAIAGRRIAGLFANRNAVRLKNRVTGGFLVLAGLSLLGYQRP